MNVHTPRSVYIAIVFFLAVISGCAQQRYGVKDENSVDKTGFAKIQAIKVSADASRIEIVADRPLIYTFYKNSEPPQAIIDLSQTDPGTFTSPVEVNSGNIKKIEVSRHDLGSGFFSRIVITLANDGDFSVVADTEDKGKLLASVAAVQQKEKRAGEPAIEAKTGPGQASDEGKNKKDGLKAEEVKPVPVAAPATEATAPPAAPEVKPAQTTAMADTTPAGTALTPDVKPVMTSESAQGTKLAEGSAVPEPLQRGEAAADAKSVSVAASQDTKPDQALAAPSSAPVKTESKPQLTEPAPVEKPVTPAVQQPEVATAADKTVKVSRQRVVTGVTASANGVEIVVDGGIDTYKVFTISKPNRLIVDIFGAKSSVATKSIAMNRFGFSKARVGVSPDKVRIVFDATKEIPRPFRAITGEGGLKILFGEAAAAAPDAAFTTSGSAQTIAKAELSPVADTPVTGSNEKTLRAINVVRDGIDVTVEGGVGSYNTILFDKPDRLVIDLVGVTNGIKAKAVAINSFGIDSARLGVSENKVRIVFDAANGKLPAYQMVKTETGLKVMFASGTAPTAAPAVTETVKAAAVETEPRSEPRIAARVTDSAIEGIEFKLEDGYSRIIIKTSGACTPGKPAKIKDGLTLTIKKCQLPRKLQRLFDTSSFGSVVRGVTPYSVKTKSGFDTRFLVRLRSAAPYSLKQEGDTIFLDIKNAKAPETEPLKSSAPKLQSGRSAPSSNEEAELITKLEEPVPAKPQESEGKAEVKRYTGRKVTLEFSDADIRKIFQLIAEVSGYNFLIADDVSGTISLKLVNVPWDQALDVIMESKSLAMKKDGNIVQIRPKGRFKTLEDEEREAQKSREKSLKLVNHVFDVNYASIGDVVGQFRTIASDRGKDTIIQDARTNKVIVTDIETKIQMMKDLLKTLDQPEKQVMIEARIVEATTTFARDMGVNWGLNFVDGTASIAGINSLTTNFGGVVSTGSGGGGITSGFSFGSLASNIQLDLKLSAAASTGIIKIISTPKVVTVNNKSAKISQGQSIPYQSTSAEGTKTEFVEAALTLEVTPHITADGNVGMKIKASNNAPGAGTPPPINKKEATTELTVKSGETTVIGGIYVDVDTDSDSGVPFLKDIPLFGWLFKSNSKSKTKTELLIFITPKILI